MSTPAPTDRPATKRQVETLERLALMHGKPSPKLGITWSEAADAIRWLSTRIRKGEEHAPIPQEDPELQPYMTLRHWFMDKPGVNR